MLNGAVIVIAAFDVAVPFPSQQQQQRFCVVLVTTPRVLVQCSGVLGAMVQSSWCSAQYCRVQSLLNGALLMVHAVPSERTVPLAAEFLSLL